MIKFLLFSDFHYCKGTYASTLNDLDIMLKKAKEENVDFCFQCGDFATDAINNLEAFDLYLNNKYDLPCYGVVGNHELEGGTDNTMELITPRLTNRPVNKPYPDASYWYTDVKGIRLIGLDSNHSFNPETKEWEHVPPGRTGARPGNTHVAHVHPVQMQWLKETLDDAQEKGLKVIVFTHHALSGAFNFNCGNSKEIRDLMEKYPKTAVMGICGDLHMDAFTVVNKIAYYSINATRYLASDKESYPEDAEYDLYELDENKNVVKAGTQRLSEIRHSNYRYSDRPMHTIVTIDDDGMLTIRGMKAEWLCGVGYDDSIESKYFRSLEIKARKYKLNF